MLIIVGLVVLVGVGIAFLYPWDEERKPKPRKFAGNDIGNKFQ